jgi:hypothetical protein
MKKGDLLSVSQFGFRAHHSATIECTRLMEDTTLNFNSDMPTAAVFMEI